MSLYHIEAMSDLVAGEDGGLSCCKAAAPIAEIISMQCA